MTRRNFCPAAPQDYLVIVGLVVRTTKAVATARFPLPVNTARDDG